MIGVVRSALALTLVAVTGCDQWLAIDPNDASKLGSSYDANVGDKVVSVKVVDVRMLNGKLVELSGDFSARATLKSGAVHIFRPPLAVHATGDDLVFSSSSEPPLDVPLDAIAKLEVTHPPVHQ
jgi:hypothetical protein